MQTGSLDPASTSGVAVGAAAAAAAAAAPASAAVAAAGRKRQRAAGRVQRANRHVRPRRPGGAEEAHAGAEEEEAP